MRKGKTDLFIEARVRVALQKEITEKYGEEAIQKVWKRLCSNCTQTNCFLLPICSDGKDCPYFKQKEVKK